MKVMLPAVVDVEFTLVLFSEGEIECKLHDILVFCSGADHVPPIGFDTTPKITFLYSGTSFLPTASTCDITVRLPTTNNNYDVFEQYIILGLKGHDAGIFLFKKNVLDLGLVL